MIEKPYTVVLLYPDYATADFGADVFIESARAETPEKAVEAVQMKAHLAQHDCGYPPEDFRMVAVFPGDLEVVRNALDAA